MADTDQGALSSLAALNRLSEDPIDKNRAWTAYAAGALKPTTGGGFGESMGNALGNMANVQGAQEALRAAYIPHVTQALVQAAQMQRQADIDRFMMSRVGGGPRLQNQTQSQEQQPASIDLNAIPPQGQISASQGAPIPQGAPVQSQTGGLENMTPDDIALMKYFGKDMLPEYKMAKFGEEMKPGSAYKLPSGEVRYMPDVKSGFTYDPATDTVKPIKNFAETNAAIEATKAGAVEAAKNKLTLLPLGYVGRTGAPVGGTIGEYLGAPATDQTPAQPHPIVTDAAQNAGMRPSLINAVIKAESGGNPNAASPKGAIGLMQLMPETAKSLGVDPTNPTQNVQGGTQYLKQMQDKYGDEKLALMAYNWGPGNVDTWLQKGANIKYIPQETKDYITKVSLNEALANRTPQVASATDSKGRPLLQSDVEKAQAAADVELKNKPGITAATKSAELTEANFNAYKDNLAKNVDEQRSLVQRNQEILPLLKQYQTGQGMAPDARLHFASSIQNSFPGNPTAKKIADKIAGGDVSAGQELNQLLSSAGLSNVIQTLQGQGRVNNAEFKALQAHAETNLSDPDTLRRLMEYQNKLYKQSLDEQQSIADAEEKGTINPKTWRARYSKILDQQALGGQTEPVSAPVAKVIASAPAPNKEAVTIKRTGTHNGRKVAEYSDGTVKYLD